MIKVRARPRVKVRAAQPARVGSQAHQAEAQPPAVAAARAAVTQVAGPQAEAQTPQRVVPINHLPWTATKTQRAPQPLTATWGCNALEAVLDAVATARSAAQQTTTVQACLAEPIYAAAGEHAWLRAMVPMTHPAAHQAWNANKLAALVAVLAVA